MPTSVYSCSLASCGWELVVLSLEEGPAVDPHLTPAEADELDERFGGGPLTAVAFATLLRATGKVDRQLREHFESHDLTDWVSEVVRLSEDLRRLNAGGPGPSWIRPSEERIENAVEMMTDLVRAVRSMKDLTDEEADAWQPSKFTRRQWERFADTVLRADAKWRAAHPEEPA